MPEEGINWLSRKELMTYEEMLRICSLLVNLGVTKIRITGGEPFVRKDIMKLLTALSMIGGLEELTVTTNGILTSSFVPEFRKIGIRSVNLSLDTLDRNRFFAIARRDELPKVLETLEQLLRHDIHVKINAVVMDGKNTEDIIPLVALTKELPVSVRFIEEMPFNGGEKHYPQLQWDYHHIIGTIREAYQDMQKVPDPPHSTAYNYRIPQHKGDVGVIAAYSRTFCGTCNRIRITPQGVLKTCLYDNGVLNIKDLIRSGLNDGDITGTLVAAIQHRSKDGWEAEKMRNEHMPVHESMATIGG
jgi:cyclic pyranopterin phosphate synthase